MEKREGSCDRQWHGRVYGSVHDELSGEMGRFSSQITAAIANSNAHQLGHKVKLAIGLGGENASLSDDVRIAGVELWMTLEVSSQAIRPMQYAFYRSDGILLHTSSTAANPAGQPMACSRDVSTVNDFHLTRRCHMMTLPPRCTC